MVFKCCVVNCRSNYASEEKTTVFFFPKEEHLRKIWIKFVNRKDWQQTNSSCICIKHFQDNCYQNDKGNKSVPAIFDPSNPNFCNSSACHITSPVSIPRKSLRKRMCEEDQYQSFLADDIKL